MKLNRNKKVQYNRVFREPIDRFIPGRTMTGSTVLQWYTGRETLIVLPPQPPSPIELYITEFQWIHSVNQLNVFPTMSNSADDLVRFWKICFLWFNSKYRNWEIETSLLMAIIFIHRNGILQICSVHFQTAGYNNIEQCLVSRFRRYFLAT